MNSQQTMDRDFKRRSSRLKSARNLHVIKNRRRPLLATLALVIGMVLLVVMAPKISNATRSLASQHQASGQLTSALSIPDKPAVPLSAVLESTDELMPGRWHQVKVKSGDSLSAVFARVGLSAQQLQRVLELGQVVKPLTLLHPGDQLKIYTDQDNQQLRGLEFDIDETHTLQIAQGGDGLTSHVIEREIERRVNYATGIIDSSLFLAAQQAGLSDNLTMELANLFGWDVDFALDIRQGDQFMLVFEELYLHGEKLRDGNILAAEFVNQGQSYRAIRYSDENNNTDYYTQDGDSVRKAFLRSPVKFSRISSRFNPRRKHPKLNTIRAHKGVDYAAGRGTPVRATGEGKVVLRGNKGGYGRTVIIQHGSSYSTLYAHLNSYARGIYNGKRVKQGQVIGYVGSTGLATGPHLHYEFRVNGVHRNPLTVKLPDAEPLPKQYLNDFQDHARQYLTQLDTLKRTVLALNTVK